MSDDINIGDIYDKNLNFLIGSGASFGLFPTLSLNIKDEENNAQTIETLATILNDRPDSSAYSLLFMHYYKSCIEPVITFDLEEARSNPDKMDVIKNYEIFISTILTILQRRKNDKKCNIFTTNYDGCFTHVADEILQKGNEDFVVNDGARGFNKRYLQAKNFNSFLCQTGVFERHVSEIPQINLIHLHGSAYWYQEQESIRVNYQEKGDDRKIDEALFNKLEGFSETLLDDDKTIEELPKIELSEDEMSQFWNSYEKLPIVNPTKWKFHETVFEEHYYQMLRMLSYELEKPNSIFITFGFSFADEHIRNLVKRSLSNPSLQVYICCFDISEYSKINAMFEIHKNVKCIKVDGYLDFKSFNEKIFTLEPKAIKETQDPVGAQA